MKHILLEVKKSIKYNVLKSIVLVTEPLCFNSTTGQKPPKTDRPLYMALICVQMMPKKSLVF